MAKSMFDGEWVTFRIDNSGIKFEMPDGSIVNDIKKMGDFDSILNRFEKKMQSATGNSSFRFNTGLRFSDTKTGYQYQDVVIRKEDYDTIIKVLEGYEASLDLGTYGDDIPNTYLANSKSEPVRLLNYTRKIEGAKARAKMKKEAYLAGGMANEDFTPKNPERMSATLFVRESEYQRLLEENKDYKNPEAAVANKIYKDTFEGTILKQKEEKTLRKRKENLSVDDEVAAYFEEEKKAEEKKQALKIKEEEEHRKKELAYEKNWYKAEENKKNEDKNSLLEEIDKRKKEEEDSVRKTSTVVKSIFAAVIILADIARRILTAVLDNAAKIDTETVESNNIGMSYIDRRSSDIFDIAHGMEKGSTFKALQSIQNSFGDVTSLDEKALATLARVMGNEVAELVNSGMGGEDPELLLERIMNAYFKNWQEGKNSLGQYVGQSEARRELVTSLGKSFPEIAYLLGRMIDDSSSGKYGREIQDYQSWRNTTQTNRTNLTDAEAKYAAELGTKYNEILAIVEDLKTSFLTQLLLSMDDLLTKIKNIKIGQSADSVKETDTRNKAKNLETLEFINTQTAMFNASTQATINTMLDVITVPTKLKEKNIKGFTYTLEDLAGIEAGIYDEKYYKEKGIENPKDYVKRGKEIADNAKLNSKIQDEFYMTVVALERKKKIEENLKNNVGSGKIEDLYLTEAAQTAKAIDLAKENSEALYVLGQLKDANFETKQRVKDIFIEYNKANPEEFGIFAQNLEKNHPGIANTLKDKIKDYKANNPGKGVPTTSIFANDEDALNLWYSLTYNPMVRLWADDKSPDTFLQSNIVDDAVKNISASDARIKTQLLQSGMDFTNGTYNYRSYTDSNGIQKLIVELVDPTGKTTSTTIDLGATTNGVKTVGKFKYTNGDFEFFNTAGE